MDQPHNGKATTKDGCRLFYRIHGNPGKPRIVLIHSLALDGSFWDGVVCELKAEFEILAYDCRGHGRSDRLSGPYSVELFAEDLAALLDHCNWPAAIIAGCSMGGCVSQAFGAAHPERARALGLIDTTAWYGPTARADWGQRAAKAAEAGFAGMIPFQVPRWFSDNFCAAHPELVESISRVFLGNDLSCYEASCAMLGEADLRAVLVRLRLPVSIVVGEEDYATPIAMSKSIHERISGSSLHVIRGARHLTPIQCPREIATVCKDLARQVMAGDKVPAR